MAMAALQPERKATRREEVQIWREATTIFMTSGHGGCSPQGLALAAWRRGFAVRQQVSIDGPLLLDGVRSEHKKTVMRLVHDGFEEALRSTDVEQVIGTALDLAGIDQQLPPHPLQGPALGDRHRLRRGVRLPA